MKQTTSLLFKIFKSYPQKASVVFLVALGLYSQGARGQERDREERHNRREEGDRRNTGRHQNPDRNHQQRIATRPPNTVRANQTNNTNRIINNRIPINRTVNYNNIYRRPIYNARDPNWRYAYVPRINSICTVFPSGYRTINYGGFGYRYYHGIFYRPQNNAFIVVAPPVGIFINILPIGYRRIYVRNYPFYYYNGTYYDYRDNNYFVVSPPVGAVVESIPDGYQTVVIDGETYYTVDGAQYKPVVQENGEIWYEVIKAN